VASKGDTMNFRKTINKLALLTFICLGLPLVVSCDSEAEDTIEDVGDNLEDVGENIEDKAEDIADDIEDGTIK